MMIKIRLNKVKMPHAIHHIYKRKRYHDKLLQYPHPNKWIRFLDNFLVVIAVIGPLLTLPQIYKILTQKTAEGISLLTWGCYAFFNIPWLIYGVVHREKPIIVAYVGWFIVNCSVLIAAIIYS